MYTFYKIRGKVLRVTKVVYNLTQEENVCFGIRSRNMIDCRRAYIGTKMELKPEAFKGKMFKVNERKIFLKKIKKILALFV